MNMDTDELALRQILADLTAGQPPAPPWRYQAVRKRLVRQRWTQAVAGGAAFAIVATGSVLAALLPASTGGAASGSRSVPAWALPWPDHRDGSAPQPVLDGAVQAWRDSHAVSNGAPLVVQKVIWYVGQTIARGRDVVLTFEASTSAGNYLVVGSAPAAAVRPGRPASSDGSPWLLYQAPAPRPQRGLVVGLNLAVPSAPVTKDKSPDNWIMLLAAPDVRAVTWTAPLGSEQSSDGSSSETVSAGYATTPDGLVIADTGQVTGRVQVTSLVAGHRNVLKAPIYVSVPGSVAVAGTQPSDVPALAAPAPLSPSRAFTTLIGGDYGQGTSGDVTWEQLVSGRPGVVARCYGPQPLRVFLDFRLLGIIPCDNAQHELLGRERARSSINVLVKTGFLTSWLIYIGTSR